MAEEYAAHAGDCQDRGSRKQARAFKKVEDVQGSGDIRPLEIAAILDLADVHFTGLHYHARPQGYGMIICEADTATGHIATGTLDALAGIATYLPVR